MGRKRRLALVLTALGLFVAAMTWLGSDRWAEAARRRSDVTQAVAIGPDGQVWLGTTQSLYRLTPNGLNPVEGIAGGVRQILVDPGNPAQVYALGNPGQIAISEDGGATWKQTRGHGLPPAPVRTFTYDPSGPLRLAALVDGHGYFQSDAAGDMWMQLGEQKIPGVTSMVINPLDPRIVLVGTVDGLYQSFNQGMRFEPVAVRYQWSLNGAISSLAVAGDRSAIIAGTDNGLYRSSDGGRSWLKLSDPGLPDVAAVAVDPRRSHRIVAASRSGSVALSTDRGHSWKSLR